MGVAVNGGNGGLSAGFSGGMAGVSTKTSITDRMRAAEKNKKKRTKKKLNYNPREISSQLVRAAKSRSATIVLIRAKSRLGLLQQAYASGQYDQNEVRTAITHAKKMVECCRLKVRNLKEEESQSRTNEREKGTENQKKKGEIKRRVRKKEQALQAKIAQEENKRILDEKMKQQQLRQKKQMHRGEEQRKMTEADMEYYKNQLNQNQGSRSVRYSGASLDLSAQAAQMAELQRMEAQIEKQVEQEVEMEYAAMEAAGESSAPMPDAGAAMESMDVGGAEIAAIDITI